MPRLIVPSELERIGQDRRKLVTLCNQGQLTRVRRGTYVNSAQWQTLTPQERHGLHATAFQLLTPTQPVFAHATAAILWGLWIVGAPRYLHVMTTATGGGRNRNGVIRHRGSMTEGVLRCGAFMCTDKITTTLALIGSLSFPLAVAVCDSSLRVPARRYAFNSFTPASSEATLHQPHWQTIYPQGPPLRPEDLVAAAQALPSKAAAQRALTVINFASHLSGSAGESLSRAKMHQHGFPAPTLQKRFVLRNGSNAFVDFWFEHIKLAGEFDGMGKYLRGEDGGGLSVQDRVLLEKAREDQIRAQGVGFVRWEWKEMMNRERFIFLLRQAGLEQK